MDGRLLPIGPALKGHFVNTNFTSGLTERHAERMVQILEGNGDVAPPSPARPMLGARRGVGGLGASSRPSSLGSKSGVGMGSTPTKGYPKRPGVAF